MLAALRARKNSSLNTGRGASWASTLRSDDWCGALYSEGDTSRLRALQRRADGCDGNVGDGVFDVVILGGSEPSGANCLSKPELAELARQEKLIAALRVAGPPG